MSVHTATASSPATNDLQTPVRNWRLKIAGRLSAVREAVYRAPVWIRGPAGPAVSLLVEGMTLGLLRSSDIDQLVSETYNAQEDYYDPRRYQQPYESRIVPVLKRLARGSRLIDCFCGQGREARVFADAGFAVTGVDRLEFMISAAKDYAAEKGFRTNFVTADFDALDVSPGFDVAYTSAWMYSTRQGFDRRLAFTQTCRRLCADGGLIVFSTVGRCRSAVFGACVRWTLARLTAACTFGNLRTEFGERIYSGLFWHHLSEAQVRREVDVAGLKVVECISGQGVQPTFYFLAESDWEPPASQGANG